MKKIEKYLTAAIDVAKTHLTNTNDKIPKEMNGYLSSFGASMINAGLLPTVVFYNQEGRGRGDRTSVILALEEMCKQYGHLEANGKLIEKIKHLYQNNSKDEIYSLGKFIKDAAIALKLAIRVFKKDTETKND